MKNKFLMGCPNVNTGGNRTAPYETCLAISFAKPVTKHRMGMAAIHKQWKEKFGVANLILIHCWEWPLQY